MAYSMMMAPFDFANHNKIAARQLFDNYAFFELTPKQAGEYFKWFKSEIPYRLELLQEYIQGDLPEIRTGNFSPESLVLLWKWFETKIEQVPMSGKEIENQAAKYPQWIEDEIRKESTKYTDITLSLALDIAIYLGEMIVQNYPYLYWWYRTKPKNEFSANRPVILRLKSKRQYFDPSRIVFVNMIKSCKKHDERSLYELYRYWEDEYFIPSKP